MPGPPQASPEDPFLPGPQCPASSNPFPKNLQPTGATSLAHQRWENVCWDTGYEMSGQRRSRVCHLGCSRRLPCLRHQPVGQKRPCWEGAGVRSGIEESGPGEGSRRLGWESRGLGFGRPGSGGAQHPHRKHSWIQSREMLDFVSWKSLLALSMPWNTWERGVASGMEGGKRVPPEVIEEVAFQDGVIWGVWDAPGLTLRRGEYLQGGCAWPRGRVRWSFTLEMSRRLKR